jgi:hypothetical protein
MSFGESMNLQGLFRKYAKNHSRSLQKALELNVAYHLKKKHLEGSRTHLAEVDPEWGPHQTDRPSGGAGRPTPGTKWARLLNVPPSPMRINV